MGYAGTTSAYSLLNAALTLFLPVYVFMLSSKIE
jgi:hypothetical protein